MGAWEKLEIVVMPRSHLNENYQLMPMPARLMKAETNAARKGLPDPATLVCGGG